MKKDTHPKFYIDALATCACGKTHNIGSTVEKIGIEICSACHPFYTGNEKILDIAGRVDKFNKKRTAATKTGKK